MITTSHATAPAVPAGPADELTLSAYEDAATLRSERAGSYCYACGSAPEGMCGEHAGDLAMAERYRERLAHLEAGRA